MESRRRIFLLRWLCALLLAPVLSACSLMKTAEPDPYGADRPVIEPETTLLPLSMVLKEMRLPPGIYWGSPTEMTAPRQPGESARETRLTDSRTET